MAHDPHWLIGREGRSWTPEEVENRFNSPNTPEKMELSRGKLYWSEAERRHMLGMLLENLGADVAVRMGDPAVWREAIDNLGLSEGEED